MRSSYYAVASAPGRRITVLGITSVTVALCAALPFFFCDNFMFVSKTLYEVEFWMEGSSHKLNTHGFDPITCIACSSTTYCIARLSLIDVLCQSFRVNLCLESFLTYRTSRYISRNKPRIFNSIMLKQD